MTAEVAQDEQHAIAVYVDGLEVVFDGFKALDQLSYIAEYGKIHGIIGPNGAGKTTLLDVITGLTKPRAGEVLLDRRVNVLKTDLVARAQLGIARKFQKPSVFDNLTVYQNIELGVRPHGGTWLRDVWAGSAASKRDRVNAVLDTVQLDNVADRLAGTLSHGQKQWLEIGMVIAREPKVLMLDEPVAGMSDKERAATATLLGRLRSPERCILLVEHDMHFVEQVSDVVAVLHEGRLLSSGSMAHVTNDPEVIRVYLGR